MSVKPQTNSLSSVTPIFALLSLTLVLSGCQTTGAQTESAAVATTAAEATSSEPEDERVSWSLYTPFADQGDHLRQLVEKKNYEDAERLYLEQKDYFDRNSDSENALLKQLADRHNQKYIPALKKAGNGLDRISWPSPASDWAAVKSSLSTARSAIDSYPDSPILQIKAFRAPDLARLAQSVQELEKKLRENAPSEFRHFDHFGGASFFDAYPISLNRAEFFNANFEAISDRLKAGTSTDLKRFTTAYPRDLLGNERWNWLSDLFATAYFSESGENGPELARLLGAARAAQEAGLTPKSFGDVKFALIETTSKTLLKEGQIEFPASIDVDLPVVVEKASLDEALTTDAATSADYLIVFDVAIAKAKRHVTKLNDVRSQRIAGYRTEPNPEYNTTQNEVDTARMLLQQATMQKITTDAQYCSGAGCFGKLIAQMAAGADEKRARQQLQDLMTKLNSTPQTVDKPVIAPYTFEKASIRAEKLMTAHYYVINRKEDTYYKSTFDIKERKAFSVAYNVDPEDPKKDEHVSNSDREADVSEWEDAPSRVKMSQLVDHYLQNVGKSAKLPKLAVLRSEMLRDKNTALATYEKTNYDARPLNDPRFDNVVMVFAQGKRALGTGFFVTPDVVLTNWHVVKESAYVEMSLYDGQETFGKVFAKDARLDIALIKVQRRGLPVKFYTARTLDLGSTVEAIGHPKSFKFSITRGVISAIRRRSSINLPNGAGDEVLYIQTDTPVNSGNSGGPLFLGNKVVGVNTWVVDKSVAEGLNFAIHYSEVVDFLRENLPSFKVQG